VMNDKYNKSMSENILLQKSFSFAIRIVRLYQYLSDSKKEHILSKQLLRSGTAVGALVREAQNAESKNDFIHKLAIAQKECDEAAAADRNLLVRAFERNRLFIRNRI
jgi:four helix bundle protein